uniref:Putative secreted protein n=1 Tax=Anopheles darlingi TaxID=43151 RepID=A0A2M4DR21_ANODA
MNHHFAARFSTLPTSSSPAVVAVLIPWGAFSASSVPDSEQGRLSQQGHRAPVFRSLCHYPVQVCQVAQPLKSVRHHEASRPPSYRLTGKCLHGRTDKDLPRICA